MLFSPCRFVEALVKLFRSDLKPSFSGGWHTPQRGREEVLCLALPALGMPDVQHGLVRAEYSRDLISSTDPTRTKELKHKMFQPKTFYGDGGYLEILY